VQGSGESAPSISRKGIGYAFAALQLESLRGNGVLETRRSAGVEVIELGLS
jgi:hypothetical protein